MEFNICKNIRSEIEEVENERYRFCSNINKNIETCVKISYNLWFLKVQEENLCSKQKDKHT
jgi:hypothetical protein